jgi:hypothetical protein
MEAAHFHDPAARAASLGAHDAFNSFANDPVGPAVAWMSHCC